MYNVNLVDLDKSCFPTSIYLQKSASIQRRTSLSKFGGSLTFQLRHLNLSRCISAALCTSSDYNSTPPNPNGTELRSCMNRGGFAWDEFIHTDDTAMLTKLREKFGAPESESATDLCNRTNSGYADLCPCLEAQSFLSSGERYL